MADAASSIFNKKAAERLRSPDDLDKFVRVTNPGVWVVLVACIALLVGLLAWGVFGAVDTNVTAQGAVATFSKDGKTENKAVCFLFGDAISEVEAGDEADVGGERMKVAEVSAVPLSAEEAGALLDGDFLAGTLIQNDWVYSVTFDGDVSKLPYGVPVPVKITVSRVAPISLILRNQG